MKSAKVIPIGYRKSTSIKLAIAGKPTALTLRNAQAERGYFVAYHPGETNRCPSCNCRKWHVGRVTAECSQCGMPLSIAQPNS